MDDRRRKQRLKINRPVTTDVYPSHPLRALVRDPAFLRVWLVGVLSGIGRWLEMLVVGVFAVEATGSPFLVALLVILRMLPLAFLGPVVGAFADRLPPQLFLSLALFLAMLVSAIVSALFWLGIAEYWHVAVSVFVAGAIWTTDLPLRRRMMGDVAGPGRLAPAMSLDSASNNFTRMLGPLIGGVLYQWLGTGGAFALTVVLYGLCVVLLLTLSPGAVSRAGAERAVRILGDLREAFRFAAQNPDILRILGVTVVFNIWGFPFAAMIPVIGADELGLSPGGIGLLAALEGAGAFAGALIIAVRARAIGYRRLYYFGTVGFLVLVFAAGWMPSAMPMSATLFCIGLCAAGFTTMQSTLIYAVAPPEMRGRLFGLLVLCIGTGLIGFSNIGLMGEWFGGTAAIRIVAVEGLVPLVLIGIGWRELWQRGTVR